jgi:hypothetical protein
VVTDLSAEIGRSLAHSGKLNRLAESTDAEDDDVLLFLDGDAFPVTPIGEFLGERLAQFPLVAVRRDENLGDVQPHPCFCATTAGFWRDIGGNWSPGAWTDDAGREVEDVGGALLQILSERGIEWCPLLRTNRHNLHPVLFGLYEERIYHHGAGFRPAFVRADLPDVDPVVPLPPWLPAEPPSTTIGRLSWRLKGKLWFELRKRPAIRKTQDAARRNDALSECVFQWIQRDPRFYLLL